MPVEQPLIEKTQSYTPDTAMNVSKKYVWHELGAMLGVNIGLVSVDDTQPPTLVSPRCPSCVPQKVQLPDWPATRLSDTLASTNAVAAVLPVLHS